MKNHLGSRRAKAMAFKVDLLGEQLTMSLTREVQDTGHEKISSHVAMAAIKAIDSARQIRREAAGEDLLKSHKHRLKGVRASTKSRKLVWSAAVNLVPGAALRRKDLC